MAFQPAPQSMFSGGLRAQFQLRQNAIVIPMNVEDPMNKFRAQIASSRNPEDAGQPEVLQRALLFFNRYQRHVAPTERHEMLLLMGASLLAQNGKDFCLILKKLNTYHLSHEDLSVILHESGISRSLLEQVVRDRSDRDSREKLVFVSICMSLLSHEDLWDAFMTLMDHFCVNAFFGEEMSSADIDEFTKLSRLITSEFLRCAMTEVEPQNFLDRITKLVTISLNTDEGFITQHAAQYLYHFLTNHPEHVNHFLETLPVLLSPRLTAPLRTFYVRLATTRPTLLASLNRNPQFQIMDWLVRSLYDTARVVPSTENNPRCLSFGTDTADWMSFLGVMGTITRQETKKAQNSGTLSLHTSMLGLLILLSSSTDIVLSDAAVSEIARGCGLSEGEVKAILFETPLSFSINPDWVLETHVPYADNAPSLCASIGPTLRKFNEADDEHKHDPSMRILTVTLVGDTLKCLVNVFDTVNPTCIPHPSFSPSLTQTPTMPSFWKAQPIATTLPALNTFVVQLIMLASSTINRKHQNGPRLRQSIGVATVLHLHPHLNATSKPSTLMFIMDQLSAFRGNNDDYLFNIFPVVLELALTDSYRTPTTLLRLTRQFVSTSLPVHRSSPSGRDFQPLQDELAASISDRLDMAEGEERWKLFTELLCTSTTLSTDTIEKMLLEAENDDQSRVVLSSLALGAVPGTVPFASQGVSFSDEGQTRLLRCAGQTNNVELASHAWNWIEKGCQLPTRQSMHGRMVGRMVASEEMLTLLLKVLGDLNNEGRGEEREGDEEGAAEREKERKTIIQYCLQILSRQIVWTNVDLTPFVRLLIPLALDADVQTVCALIEVFAGIATRTSNSANPISLSTVDVPVASQSSPVTQSLLSFVSSFLLKSILARPQSSLFTTDPFKRQTQPLDEMIELTIVQMFQNLEGDQSGTVESVMKRMIEIGNELLESSVQARKNQSSPLHHVTSLLTPQSNPNLSPNKIWMALHTFLFSSPRHILSIDALCKLSEVLNRLVETMVKTSCDCVSGEEEYISVQLFFSSIVTSLMTPLITVKQKEWVARPSLSNLLHSTATLLIRHDSSLSELIGFAENAYQGMQRGDERERKNPRTYHQHDTSRVDLILSALAEEGVEDRVEMSAHCNQRSLQFLGANAIPMLTGTGMFVHPGMGFPFGNAQMVNQFENAQMATPLGNAQNATPFGNARNAAPFGNAQNAAPFGNAQNAAPFGNAQNATPFGNAQNATPFGNAQNATPFGNAQNANPFGNM
ncbi:hypothetical protein BLNAU_189 [Blattamonas nauphoetae]|uniref:Uncharacterized protein n=1 Tax=Blattamonas nauphoetae TaxID=2049346 RepID=A0ABQ9YM97_9EUKA|nr:hypothetical protein BLNAU_189 [Blattamonas nauphoetae]